MLNTSNKSRFPVLVLYVVAVFVIVLFASAFALSAQNSFKQPQSRQLKLSPYSQPNPSIVPDALSGIRPRFTTIRELASNPRKFDRQYVQLRAWPAMGWEGDNYLFEQPYRPGMLVSGAPALWIYTSDADLGGGFDGIRLMNQSGGFFRGYFHYVANSKSNGMFNPGPLQFDVTSASKLK